MAKANQQKTLTDAARDDAAVELLDKGVAHLNRHYPGLLPDDYETVAHLGSTAATPASYSLARLIDPEGENDEIGYFATTEGMRQSFDAAVLRNASDMAAHFARTDAKAKDYTTSGSQPDGYVIRRGRKTGAIRELKANQSTLVVIPDAFGKDGVDMQAVTFYPTLDTHLIAYETGRDLRDDLRLTKAYHDMGPVGRAYLMRACDPQAKAPDCPSSYNPYRDELTIPLRSGIAAPRLSVTGPASSPTGRLTIQAENTKVGTIRIYPEPDGNAELLQRQLTQSHPAQWACADDMLTRLREPYDPEFDKSPIGDHIIEPYRLNPDMQLV